VFVFISVLVISPPLGMRGQKEGGGGGSWLLFFWGGGGGSSWLNDSQASPSRPSESEIHVVLINLYSLPHRERPVPIIKTITLILLM